jgi:multicomponent Na+:H+ antiporter subunit G
MRIFETAVFILLVISGIFAVLGSIGLLRFPDFYTRSHAATIISMGGMSLALFALMIQTFWDVLSAKLMLIIIINLFANPTTTHVIANLAYRQGVKPRKLVKDELKDGKGVKRI